MYQCVYFHIYHGSIGDAHEMVNTIYNAESAEKHGIQNNRPTSGIIHDIGRTCTYAKQTPTRPHTQQQHTMSNDDRTPSIVAIIIIMEFVVHSLNETVYFFFFSNRLCP